MKLHESQRPPLLKPGDTIGICAPARKISREELETAVQFFESNGFYVALSEHLFDEHHQFSGTDEDRAADLQYFLDDPQIKAIISARGGYGTMRIIDRICFSEFVLHPKWIIGYSDITVLHSHIHQNFSIQTLHATMPINFGKDEFSTMSLIHALKDETLSYKGTNETGTSNRNGFAKAPLVGGNLSLLYALQGSSSDINTDGRILFIEDLDEYLYHMDRMMLSLKRSGKLSKLAGLIVGGMDDMKDNAIPYGKNAEAIIMEHVAEYHYPVCFGFPAGHGVKNVALRIGAMTSFEVSGKHFKLEQI